MFIFVLVRDKLISNSNPFLEPGMHFILRKPRFQDLPAFNQRSTSPIVPNPPPRPLFSFGTKTEQKKKPDHSAYIVTSDY